ncbi:MAG: hypothetical protein JWO10_2249 [Microbacteriaceae bacterium]|nr:hypothetical protein [Microbacteriaceae bacterium]
MAVQPTVTTNEYIEVMAAFSRYSRAIDGHDWEGLHHAFAEDALWIMATGLETRGIEGIKNLMRDFEADLPYRTMHAVSNIQLFFEGDTVRSTSNWTTFIRKAPEGGQTNEMHVYDNAWYVGSIGTYDDRLQKFGDEWLITYRKIDNWEFSEPAWKA